MDVALAADRRRVAQSRRHLHDRGGEPPARVGLLGRRGEGLRGEDGAAPRAEVLGGELLAADLAEVGIDVRGAYGLPLPILVEVLEQLVAREILAAPPDAGERPAAHVDGGVVAPRAAELQT